MNTERQRRIRAAFDAASSLPPGDQTDFVRRNAGADVELAESVLRLLRASRDSDKFLSKPLFPKEVKNALGGMRIGAYRTVREIGAGGMGVVYLATRADDAYRRVSALKVIRATFNTPAMIERFLHERQILAELDHHNIARIVDGGTTPDGLPYFVMDYIDGLPIDVFANARQAEIGQRLNLFRQACTAVQYLHDNHIVHRDLKPANMLVTSGGTVKLLDFGLAKVLDADTNKQKNTVTLMTEAYASPEQFDNKPISPASDIFSLGAILYEMLTGELPRETVSNTTSTIRSTRRSKEIKRPSTRNRTNAQLRTKESPADLSKKLKGDLDSILMKALREEPEQRYASVNDFAADIENYQAHRPVAARNGATLYVVSRFTRRHPLGIAAVAVIAACLTVIAWMGWRLHQYETHIKVSWAPQQQQLEALMKAAPPPTQLPRPGQTAPPNTPAATSSSPIFDQQLSETIVQVGNNYKDTFPRLIDNPLASQKTKEDILNHDLQWLQQVAPYVGQKPDLASDLGQAYLQIAKAQYSSDTPSLNNPSASSTTCEDALNFLGSHPDLMQSDKIRNIAGELEEYTKQIPPSQP